MDKPIRGVEGYEKLYRVFDLVAESYVGGFQLFRSDAPACRMFSDSVKNPQSGISEHVADFELHCLGLLDERGLLVPAPDVRTVITGAHVLASMSPREVPDGV